MKKFALYASILLDSLAKGVYKRTLKAPEVVKYQSLRREEQLGLGDGRKFTTDFMAIMTNRRNSPWNRWFKSCPELVLY